MRRSACWSMRSGSPDISVLRRRRRRSRGRRLSAAPNDLISPSPETAAIHSPTISNRQSWPSMPPMPQRPACRSAADASPQWPRRADARILSSSATRPPSRQAPRRDACSSRPIFALPRLAANGGERLRPDARRHDLEVERVLRQPRFDRTVATGHRCGASGWSVERGRRSRTRNSSAALRTCKSRSASTMRRIRTPRSTGGSTRTIRPATACRGQCASSSKHRATFPNATSRT